MVGRGAKIFAVGVISVSLTIVVVTSARAAVEPLGNGSPAAPQAAAELKRITLPGAVYDLTFDQARNSLWFAYMSSGAATLYRYDISTGMTTGVLLPPTDHNGYLERVAVGPDGAIWLTEEYMVVRYDPTSQVTRSIKLAEADADATPTALARTDPSPGTWPCAITFDSGGRALVARHNVKSLLRLDSSLGITGRVPLPFGIVDPANIVDFDGRVYVAAYGGTGRGATMDEQGGAAAIGPVGAIQFAEGPLGVVSLGSAGLSWLTPGSASVGFSVQAGPLDKVALARTGAVVYSQNLGVITKVTTSATIASEYKMAGSSVQVMNPLGQLIRATAVDSVGAMAVDSNDSIWIVDISNTAAELVQLGL